MKISLEKIANRDPKLYLEICEKFLIRSSDNIRVLDINEAKFNWLPPETRVRIQVLEAEFESETEEGQAAAANAETERQQKIQVETEAYKARLLQYVHEQDLEPSIANADTIRKWIDENVSVGHISSKALDAAISNLGPRGRKVLTFKPKVAPTPPTPPPPPAVILSDGSEQLPLDAAPTYKHTKAQLADLAKRQLAAAKKDRGGWHGTSL